jgi:adenylate cyclase class 2
MLIEAELKARVSDIGRVRNELDRRAEAQIATYRDTYYDTEGRQLAGNGEELRLRTVTTAGCTKHLFTYKAPPVDRDSGSKPEYETTVEDRDAVEAIMSGLGFQSTISL